MSEENFNFLICFSSTIIDIGTAREGLKLIGVEFLDDVIVGKEWETIYFKGVKLPDGWRKEETEANNYYDFLYVDDKGRIRAKSRLSKDKECVYILSRYRIYHGGYATLKRADGQMSVMIIDQSDENSIYLVEKTIPHSMPGLFRMQYLQKTMVGKAKDWLEKDYPDWENPFAYWDEV